MSRIEVIVKASSLHDARRIAQMKGQLLEGVRTAGELDLVEVSRPSADALAVILVLTGGVEREALKVVAQLPSPVLLIAHPGHNSLPAAMEILARIRQNGGDGRILFGSPERIAGGLQQEHAVASAWEALRFSRLGLIGEPSDWLVASDVDRAFLRGRLSIELVEIEVDELIERVAAASPSRQDIARFTRGASRIDEPDKETIRGAVAIYQALRALIDDHRLTACTVRCFDLAKRLRNTGCYALSRLNDERVPAGCEGDLQSLLSLYVAFLLSGTAAFMGNITSVDTEARRIGVAHCTCPLSMTSHYAIRSHFESDLGVAIAGTLPAGPCTVFRFGGDRLDQLFVREGAIERSTVRDDLCRTQIEISVDGSVDDLLRLPLGNHHIVLGGRHRETIERFHERYLRS